MSELEALIEKYRKNRTMVPAEDLKGKYKKPYEALKAQLGEALQQYIIRTVFSGLTLRQDFFEDFEINFLELYNKGGYPKRFGDAVFKNFSMAETRYLAETLRTDVERLYDSPIICLYAKAECFTPDAPQTPLAYNRATGKFWDEAAENWREPAQGEEADALLLFIRRTA